MSAQEVIGPAYLLQRLLSGPSAGTHNAVILEAGQHNASDSVHWSNVYHGTDRAAFEAACRAAGIEVPTNPVTP